MHTKLIRPLIALLMFCFVIHAPTVEARLLKRKFAREMSGTYPARFRGFGSRNGNMYFINTTGFIFVGTGSRRQVGPSGLVHTIKFRRPTGRARNAKFKGVYKGRFVNPDTGLVERVRGARVANVRKKGRGRSARYTVRFRDFIFEGSLAYQRLKGRGKKR